MRHLFRQLGLAGAGLALHQQGPFERHGGIDRDDQVFGGDVAVGRLETHGRTPLAVARGRSLAVRAAGRNRPGVRPAAAPRGENGGVTSQRRCGMSAP
ncbi:hypothetical protein SDC9_96445 [bioreactor metagenome]|uniref:Uncharacterized protein n=1 Tax=bioreactor metagenome TaxID=1076179 RepID=A0A645AJ90_9ZZZZ